MKLVTEASQGESSLKVHSLTFEKRKSYMSVDYYSTEHGDWDSWDLPGVHGEFQDVQHLLCQPLKNQTPSPVRWLHS